MERGKRLDNLLMIMNLLYSAMLEQRKTYTDLKWTRNAAVHGSSSQGTQNYIENEEQFRMLFNQALELYKNVIGDKLC